MAQAKKRESKRAHDKKIRAVVDEALRRTAPGASAFLAPARNVPSAVHVPPDALETVMDAVTTMSPSGRFGEKVFISEIWRRVGRQVFPTFDDFRRWLIANNRQGNLVLARADLVGAMDRDQVRASEIEDRGATFHFVLDPTSGKQQGW